MGNIHGWMGPLSNTYKIMQMTMQRQIIREQRSLGITVALPSFAGHVPVGLAKIYSNVTFTPVERWNNFPNKYCCGLFVEPNENLFKEIAVKFLYATTAVYGSNHIYFCDPFNEIQPRVAEVSYLRMTAYNIYKSMTTFDKSAVWLLQGWMFVKNAFWSDELIKAFLTAVPIGKMIVLDLQSEQSPQYVRTHSFYGQPFIWCMLHNFGGTLGLHGSVNIINSQIRTAQHLINSSMIGVGITPEGIFQNYAIYSLALERAWVNEDFDLNDWFSRYSDARYGITDTRLQEAWLLLKNSVYSYYGVIKIHGKYTISLRPSLHLTPWIWYNSSMVYMAWDYLLAANSSAVNGHYSNYKYDLIDVSRQFLQIMADKAYINLVDAYRNKNKKRFNYASIMFKDILMDLEHILITDNNFLLGRWIKSAKELGRNNVEKRLYEINARTQITVWGPTDHILDYATKQWSGVVLDYYLPRWILFLDSLNKSLIDNVEFDNELFKKNVNKNIEIPFTSATKMYEINSIGCAVKESKRVFKKWKYLRNNDVFNNNLPLNVMQIN